MGRGKHDVYAEILTIAKQGGVGKTKIMYQANLSWKQLNQHLDTLLSLRLIEKNSTTFRTTVKGLVFLKHINEANKILKQNIAT